MLSAKEKGLFPKSLKLSGLSEVKLEVKDK